MYTAKVLVVDDEVPFLEVMTKRLEKRNLSVLTATGGAEALGILAEDGLVDVVVLDVKMPDLDGIQTLREIKQDFPLVEVIMLTGHATMENAIEGMKLGAFDYLMKPCNVDQLIHKVGEAKEKKARHEEKILQAQMSEMTEISADRGRP